MNILHFLKSRVGAASKAGLFGMIFTLGMAGYTIYNYAVSTPAVQEQKVRRLADLMSSGGDLGVYSSMKFDASKLALATAEERAKMEGTLFDGGEGAVSALNGLKVPSNGGVDGINVEGSALAAGEKGLGMGANQAVEIGGGSVAHGAQKGDVSGVDGAAKGASKEADGGKKLQRADVTRVSGGSGGASFSGSGKGGGYGASAGAGSRSVAQERANRISPTGADSISGAAPGNGPLVARSPKFQGAHSSSFVDVKGRNSRVGVGIHSEVGNTLKDIAIISGETAENAGRYANEASRAFMYGQKGVSFQADDIQTGLTFGGEGTDKYSKAGAPQINLVDDGINEVDKTEREKASHRRRLLQNMLILLCTTFIAMIAISKLMESADPWSKVAVAVIFVAVAAAIALFLADAGKYANKYGEWGHFVGFAVAGAVMFAGLCISLSGTTNGWLKTVANFFGEHMGAKLIGGALAAVLLGKAFSATESSIDAIDHGYDDDKKDGLSNQ